MQSKAFQWVAGTAVLIIFILAGGWFLLVSNVFAEASELHEDREMVEQSNEALRLRVAGLKAQFERLDELRAELASLRVGIPTQVELDAVVDQLAAHADQHDVVMVGTSMSQVTEVGDTLATVLADIEKALAPEEDATESADSQDNSAGAQDDADAPSPSKSADATTIKPIEGLYSIPVIVNVQGTYANARTFLSAVQESMDRLYLVQTIAVTTLLQADGGNGLPPNDTGDVSLSVAGHFFVLTDPHAPIADGDELRELPSGNGSTNPFKPIAGVDEDDAANTGGSRDESSD